MGRFHFSGPAPRLYKITGDRCGNTYFVRICGQDVDCTGGSGTPLHISTIAGGNATLLARALEHAGRRAYDGAISGRSGLVMVDAEKAFKKYLYEGMKAELVKEDAAL